MHSKDQLKVDLAQKRQELAWQIEQIDSILALLDPKPDEPGPPQHIELKLEIPCDIEQGSVITTFNAVSHETGADFRYAFDNGSLVSPDGALMIIGNEVRTSGLRFDVGPHVYGLRCTSERDADAIATLTLVVIESQQNLAL